MLTRLLSVATNLGRVLPVVLLAATLPATQESSGPTRAADGWLLRNVTLIDGTGAPPRPGVHLVIRGGRVEAIEDQVPEATLAGLRDIDLSGHHCTPGLIDVHTHLAAAPSRPDYRIQVERQLRDLLGTGITDVRDMAGDGRVLAFLARQTQLGELCGPDIHFAALLGGPRLFGDRRVRASSRGAELGAAPWAHRVGEDTDLAALMQRVSGCGARGVKIYSDLTPELTARVARAAHDHGLQSWAHWVVSPQRTRARHVVEAGVQVVSHAHMLMHDAAPRERGSFESVLEAAGGEGLLSAMAERGTILDATLVAGAALRTPPDWVDAGTCAAEIVRAARARGIRVATGSDRPAVGGLPAIHSEFRLLVDRVGMTPGEVVASSSRVGAAVLGLDAQRGTLEVGRDATLLIYAADPTVDVARLAEPVFVMKRGVVWSGPALRGAGPAPSPLQMLDPSGG